MTTPVKKKSTKKTTNDTSQVQKEYGRLSVKYNEIETQRRILHCVIGDIQDNFFHSRRSVKIISNRIKSLNKDLNSLANNMRCLEAIMKDNSNG